MGETGLGFDIGQSLWRFRDVTWSQLADSALRLGFRVLLMNQDYMPTVLNVPKREIHMGKKRSKHGKQIQEMVDRIVKRFDPEKIILFGSHARGDAGPLKCMLEASVDSYCHLA